MTVSRTPAKDRTDRTDRNDVRSCVAWFERRFGEPNSIRRFVLIHGVAISSEYMVPLAGQLCSSGYVVAPDLPGFGRTQLSGEVLDIDELADELARWIEASSLAPCVVVASSFGCHVAVSLAVRHPALASSLVLLGPTVDVKARNWFRQFGRLLRCAPYERVSLVGKVLRSSMRTGLRRTISFSNNALHDNLETKLRQIQQPTLVVRGSRDKMVPRTWAEQVVGAVPDARLETIDRAGHAPNYSYPEETGRLIIEFIDDKGL